MQTSVQIGVQSSLSLYWRLKLQSLRKESLFAQNIEILNGNSQSPPECLSLLMNKYNIPSGITLFHLKESSENSLYPKKKKNTPYLLVNQEAEKVL